MRKTSALSTLFGFGLLAGLAYALWYVARAGVALFNGAGLFDGVPRPTLMILATSALTLLLAAWMIAGALRAIARREETAQRRDGRSAAYEVFLQSRASAAAEGVFTVRGAVVPVEHSGAHELLLLHASPAVLGAYARLRRAEESGSSAQDEMVELIRAMRRDLGQRAPDAPSAEIAELIGAPERGSGYGKEGLTRSQRS